MTRDKKKAESTLEVSPAEENNPTPALAPEVQEKYIPQHPENSAPQKTPTFGRRAWSVFVFLFKLTLTLAILAALGIGLYIGVPIVYNKYILPVQNNTAQLTILETRQQQLSAQLVTLQAQIDAVSTQQADDIQSITELETRLKTLETEIAAQTQTLAALEKSQVTLQNDNDAAKAELDRQIKLLKSMELLSRARLFLYQSNFGLAKQDVQAARELLAEIQPTAPQPLNTELAEVVHRLDLTLASLPAFPVAASDDLDIAWQILLQGIPTAPVITEIPTGTLPPENTDTPSTTPIPAATATP